MMDAKTIALVQDSWKKVVPIEATAADLFYDRLFELDPALRTLFRGDMAEQKQKLMQMIGTAVNMLDRLDELVPVVHKLGSRHYDYGVEAKDYDTVGTALLDTLEKGLGEAFTGEVEAAWAEVYAVLKTTMLSAEPVSST